MSLPVLLCLALSLAGARRALWLDEAATLGMARQSLPQLLRTLGNIDAVHGLYYLIMHGWMEVVGYGPLQMRLPSAASMALACAGVVLIGRLLAGPALAVAAGMSFALLPVTWDYGAEARSYAITVALVCWASLWLIRALTTGRVSHWVLYCSFVFLGALTFVYALLLIPAHALTLAWIRVGRGTWRRFCAAATGGTVLALPLVALVVSQRGQVGWLQSTSVKTLAKLPFTWMPPIGAGLLPAAALAVVTWAVLAVGLARWWRRRGDLTTPGHVDVPHLALPWLVLPTAVLVSMSLFTPLFSPRYVVFSSPALALLLGWAIIGLGSRRASITVAGLVVALSLPGLVAGMSQAGRDSWSIKREVIAQHAQPGDVLMATPYYYMSLVDTTFGTQFRRVQQGGPNPTPITWVEAPEQLIKGRVATADRVWLIPFDGSVETQDAARLGALLGSSFDVAAEYPAGNAVIRLYARRD